MKRLLSVFLIFALLFTLTACAGEEISTPPVEENKTQTTPPVDPVPEDPTEETPEKAPAEENILPTASALQLERGKHHRQLYHQAADKTLCEVTWESLQLSAESAERYPKLAAELRRENNRTFEEHVLRMDDLSELAYEGLDELGSDFNGYTVTTRCYIHRADEKVLSIRVYEDEYMGGAHPNYGVRTLNFDTATGAALELSDIIADLDRLVYTLADKLESKYPFIETDGLTEQLQAYNPGDYTWTLDGRGITFWFSPYEIAPYAAGLMSVTITFAEWPSFFFMPEYTAEADYVTELVLYEEKEVDFDPKADGIDQICVVAYADVTGILDPYLVVNGEDEYPLSDCHAYTIRPSLVCEGGQYFLFVEGVAESDVATLYVYRLEAGVPILTDTVEGGAVSLWGKGPDKEKLWFDRMLTDPTCIELESTVQLLGTWSGRKTYTFDPDAGVYRAAGEVYEITAEDPIHTALEIEVTVDGKTEKLPADTALWLVRTDGETYAELETEEGRLCRIDFIHEDHRPLIGGIPEWECFSDLRYAG